VRAASYAAGALHPGLGVVTLSSLVPGPPLLPVGLVLGYLALESVAVAVAVSTFLRARGVSPGRAIVSAAWPLVLPVGVVSVLFAGFLALLRTLER
jgi:hypothetical protein